jgi:hypothetical protein
MFWSAPHALDSDFTPEDPLALDYLGQQVGLWLFKGFTTRTSRAQNYAVVLYGLDLADKAVQKYEYSSNDETRLRLFERWERFWALATLEFRNGAISRGDEDAMRGVSASLSDAFLAFRTAGRAAISRPTISVRLASSRPEFAMRQSLPWTTK